MLKNALVKKELMKKEPVKKAPMKQEKAKKAPVKKEMVNKEILKQEKVMQEFPSNIFEMQETEVVHNYMKSPSTREGRNGMTRVSREEINDKINEAIDALGASKRSVSADKLRRADEEIEKALRILLRAQGEINTRRNWYITE
ncbi:hypothetical protein [Paenibacillus andongensis]|uniref:hypothetical protein n=1 Tax=Paenibacillus andongensis TaxID=2975482 RepID=UPI0021BB5F91|nr:hypothetical protein [Paenibacillus andongensis]